MKNIVSLLLIICLCQGAISPHNYPSAEITNGIIQAELHLPDAQQGYYRGSRFDWSGVTPRLTFKDHNYFGVWNPLPYDPRLHDAITGPVQEFRNPLGYDEAKVGEPFVKIGVGALKKIQEPLYRFSYAYEIVNPGKWMVKNQKDEVRFSHEFNDDATGYSYLYTKIVRLVKGKPVMVLQHSLTNTGKKRITTDVYNHNFFVIDDEPTGPNIKMSFPFDVKHETNTNRRIRGFDTIVQISGKSLIYNRGINKGEQVFSSGLEGFRPVPEDYRITIENLKSGAGVTITSDAAIEKLIYWACPTTACPEPYININIAPGEEKRWTYTYEFFEGTPGKR